MLDRITPEKLFSLDELDRVVVNGVEYAIYSDGQGRYALPAAQYDAEIREVDDSADEIEGPGYSLSVAYSEWCSSTDAVATRDMALRILDISSVDSLTLAGVGDVVGGGRS